jgi:hypothetical protein
MATAPENLDSVTLNQEVQESVVEMQAPCLNAKQDLVQINGSRGDVVQINGSRGDVVQINGSRGDVVQINGSRGVSFNSLHNAHNDAPAPLQPLELPTHKEKLPTKVPDTMHMSIPVVNGDSSDKAASASSGTDSDASETRLGLRSPLSDRKSKDILNGVSVGWA